MLKIGDFSRICQVSIKALRHWDTIGLLTPAMIDTSTGYRYYTIEQVAEVNRILALKTIGLELSQIGQLVKDNPTADDIRAMLRLKQVELQHEIEKMNAMLTMVESRIQHIEDTGKLSPHEVTLKPMPEQTVLSVRQVLPTMQDLVNLLRETYPYARQRTSTHLLAIFHDDAYHHEQLDVEIGFPIDHPQTPIALQHGYEMKPRLLPPIELLASTVHHGTWLTLPEGYMHLGRWIVANGYRIIGAGREIFHHIDWENDQKTTVTELMFPIAKVS